MLLLDTACRGGHVLTNQDMLVNLRPSNQSISGISNTKLQSTFRGNLPGGLLGSAYCVPNATGNLLSVHSLIKNGGSFQGDEKSLNVFDARGHLLVSGVNTGNDFWSVRYGDLVSPGSTHTSTPTLTNSSRRVIRAPSANTITALVTSHPQFTSSLPPALQLSTEERTRARDAFELCTVLAHPGDAALVKLHHEQSWF